MPWKVIRENNRGILAVNGHTVKLRNPASRSWPASRIPGSEIDKLNEKSRARRRGSLLVVARRQVRPATGRRWSRSRALSRPSPGCLLDFDTLAFQQKFRCDLHFRKMICEIDKGFRLGHIIRLSGHPWIDSSRIVLPFLQFSENLIFDGGDFFTPSNRRR